MLIENKTKEWRFMITLDYRTYNFAHGLTGIVYSSWENYAFSLGYLTNPMHHKDLYPNVNALISLRYEQNDTSGAVGKEGRIQYYGDINYLMQNFPDWFASKSAGNGNMTCRINSNDYVFNSLVYDYSFKTYIASGEKTIRVYPPDDPNSVLNTMLNVVSAFANTQDIIYAFKSGFNL